MERLAFVNVESLVVTFLIPELDETIVADRLPADYDGTSAAVIVTRVGGRFYADDNVDRALVKLSTYGPSKATALDLAGRVRGLLWQLPKAQPPTGIVVAEVAEENGPMWTADSAYPGANRYVTRFLLMVRIPITTG